MPTGANFQPCVIFAVMKYMHHLSGLDFFVLESWRMKTIGVIKMNARQTILISLPLPDCSFKTIFKIEEQKKKNKDFDLYTVLLNTKLARLGMKETIQKKNIGVLIRKVDLC